MHDDRDMVHVHHAMVASEEYERDACHPIYSLVSILTMLCEHTNEMTYTWICSLPLHPM
jgi:hypothetical protein